MLKHNPWHYKFPRLVLFSFLLLLCIAIAYFTTFAVDYLRIAAKIRYGEGRKVQVQRKSEEFAAVQGESGNVSFKVVTKSAPTSDESRCNSCSLGFCSSNPELALFSAASTEIQAFLNLTFHCKGEIVAWKFLDLNPAAGKVIYLDVLKYNHLKDEGTWMGFNKIMTTGADGWVTYEIPEKERVRVEPGLFVGMHYDDVAGDPVIPFADDTANPAGFSLSDGFTVLMDHQELSRVAKVGVVAEVGMSKLFSALLIQVKRNWRAPALAAIVLPLNS